MTSMTDKTISDEAFVEMLGMQDQTCRQQFKLPHLQVMKEDTKELDHEINVAYSPIRKDAEPDEAVDEAVDDKVDSQDDLDVPPPGPLKRQIAGEHLQQMNIEEIELFGLSEFIKNNMSMFTTEYNAPLHIYLNNPSYIQAQLRFLERKKRY